MLSFIAANYKKGDSIDISCSEGKYSGKIAFVNHEGIVLLLPNGNVCGISAADLHSFTAPMPAHINEPETAQNDTTVSVDNTVAPAAPSAYTTELPHEETPEEAPVQEQPAAEGKLTSIADVIEPQAEPEDGNALTGALSTPAVKVVGKIPLEELNKIDRKRNKSAIFNKKDKAENVNESEAKCIPPMGRITFFNSMKGFGFIHDEEMDADVYFCLNYIVDDTLKRNVKVGQPVVYSVKRNSVGYVAMGIHSPAPVDELLDLVDAHIEKGRFNSAEAILGHVLKVDASNRDAQDLMKEVKYFLPKEQKTRTQKPAKTFKPAPKKDNTFNDDVLYAKAKRAALEKKYDEAEKLYVKALHAGQRIESCVKDLLQIYVTRYKMQDTPEASDRAYDAAIEAYQKYKHYLSNDLSTLQFLAGNFYLPLNAYETYLNLSRQILANPEIGPGTKRTFYLWQQALALHKLKRDDEALAVLEEGLKTSPNHTQMKNLKEVIEHPELFPYDNPAVNIKGENNAAATAAPESKSAAAPAEEPATEESAEA